MMTERRLNMKRVLFLFLENGPAAIKALERIRNSGFNGTLVGAASLRHAFDERLPEERAFFSLTNWEADNRKESTVSMFIIEDDHIDILKGTIREVTESFHLVSGALFSLPLDDYEGIF